MDSASKKRSLNTSLWLYDSSGTFQCDLRTREMDPLRQGKLLGYETECDSPNGSATIARTRSWGAIAGWCTAIVISVIDLPPLFHIASQGPTLLRLSGGAHSCYWTAWRMTHLRNLSWKRRRAKRCYAVIPLADVHTYATTPLDSSIPSSHRRTSLQSHVVR